MMKPTDNRMMKNTNHKADRNFYSLSHYKQTTKRVHKQVDQQVYFNLVIKPTKKLYIEKNTHHYYTIKK